MEDQDPNELSNDGKETYKDNTNEEFMIGKIFSILGLFKFYRTRVKSSNQYYMFCIHEGFYKSQKKTENEN